MLMLFQINGKSWRVPVIATNVGGIPEIIEHGKTGLLCQHEDGDGLAAAIESLLLDPERLREIGTAGFERVKADFNREKFAKDISNIYRGILN